MNSTVDIILGIETSCDETAAAVYHREKGLLSSALFSQIELHKQFGGVIPEVASRSQLEKINPIIRKALDDAHIDLSHIQAIAVTNKPGLPGSLLVGVCFAKAMAWAQNIPIIGVNHLEGHAFSSFLEHSVPFPHLCLTASGGHTSLYLIEDFGHYTTLGETQDDAAGEAFDKIAKLLELGYPGGPIIERLAHEAHFEDYFHYPRGNQQSLNFSFSGLKTAVLYNLVKQQAYDMEQKKLLNKSDILKQHVASSLLVCVADIFVQKLQHALTLYPSVQAITFVGGVACNKYIRARIQEVAEQRALGYYVPSARFCTDNAAMIAFVGNYKALKNQYSDLYLDILR
jgi:N6-L-threonylcarbamoyladenine synthase